MIRTQLYLDEALHSRLKDLARQQGRTISELVREAIARTFGDDDLRQRRDSLEGIFGIWRDRKDLGSTDEYVRRLRRDTRRQKGPRSRES